MLLQYVSLLLHSRLLQCFQQRASFIPFALPLKRKRLLKRWVHVIRQTNLPLNRHARIRSKHFVNIEGKHLYLDKVPLLPLPSNNRSSNNNWRKRPRYQSASLGDEPLTIVIAIVRSWHECPCTCASPEVPHISRVVNFPFSLRAESFCSTP